jgi:glycerol-1-phosphate dehydrogenase [NAD(P)+]
LKVGIKLNGKKILSTKIIEINSDATNKLNDYLNDNYKGKKILIVCDRNTERFHNNITVNHNAFVFNYNLHATPENSDKLNHLDYDVSIACGAGVIHDIARFNAHERNKPFISYPTAPSVDGFVSNIAAMTVDGRKKTLPSTPPQALFADPSVFSTAPRRLTASGVCDIIGKYISLFDWKFCSYITGEPLDYEIIKMLEDALNKLLKLKQTDENYTTAVMDGLVLSGMAIQMFGSSRPASGAEHHLSHLWEMHCINEETDALHGEKVGVATLMVLKKYKSYAGKAITYNAKSFKREYLEPVYGVLTDGIIDENTPSSLAGIKQSDIDSHIDKIHQIIEELPDTADIEKYYDQIGAVKTLEEIGLPADDEFIEKTFNFAHYVRNRITMLKII